MSVALDSGLSFFHQSPLLWGQQQDLLAMQRSNTWRQPSETFGNYRGNSRTVDVPTEGLIGTREH